MRHSRLEVGVRPRRAMALLVLLSVLGFSLLAAETSQAANPTASANAISVSLSPSSIKANGTSTTTASASGFPLFDAVSFIPSDPSVTVGPTSVNLFTGVYSATITSSTNVTAPTAPVIITATDGTSTGTARLVQSGPAARVSVSLTNTTIRANGGTTIVTALVTDALGNGVSGEPVAFSATAGDTFGPVQDNGDGTYSATITSSGTVSTPPADVTITATDGALSGTATLVQFGTAVHVAVGLIPSSIAANGSSTTTAVATVTDANGNRVPGDSVSFAANNGTPVPGTDQGNGIYTATINSTTIVGSVSILATDTSVTPIPPTGQATLHQIAGPASSVKVLLNPTSIPASGLSTTTATATVTDAQSHPIVGDTVAFVSTDPGNTVGPTTDNGNGTYTATVTSSTTPGTLQVVAVDQTTGIHGQATLTQVSGPSTATVKVVPSQPATNQTVTIIATVTVTLGSPSGTVAFENAGAPISGCDSVAVAPAVAGDTAASAACQTSFAAVDSPVPVTAVFTPSAGNLGGSASPADMVTVDQDSTTTNLTASSSKPTTGSTVTYLAAIVPKHGGPTPPTGLVKFSDGKNPLSGCASQPLLHGTSSSGAAAAVCRISFNSPGTHDVTARYVGDPSFTGSVSSTARTIVHRRPPPPRLLATLQWSFFFAPSYTNVLLLKGNNVPPGAFVHVKCHGQGCPFGKRTIGVSNAKSCKPTLTLRCTKQTGNTVDLIGAFRHHRLKVGTQLRVEILRPGWIGKYYLFTVRARRAPSQAVSCLAPGSARPGVGC